MNGFFRLDYAHPQKGRKVNGIAVWDSRSHNELVLFETMNGAIRSRAALAIDPRDAITVAAALLAAAAGGMGDLGMMALRTHLAQLVAKGDE